jgi:hypothetical protein
MIRKKGIPKEVSTLLLAGLPRDNPIFCRHQNLPLLPPPHPRKIIFSLFILSSN